jgi:hypothetical protein
MQDLPPGRAQSFTERFFSQARGVLLEEAQKLDFEPTDILEIAQDRAMREDFRKRFQQEANNPELGKLILDYLDGVDIQRVQMNALMMDSMDMKALGVCS